MSTQPPRSKIVPGGSETPEKLRPVMPLDVQGVLESMGEAFYALDAEWQIVYANRRALAFWNAISEEVIGQVLFDRFPALRGTFNERVLREVAAHKKPIAFEAPSPVTGIWVSVNVCQAGEGVAVYWHDISERKEAERALRDREEHLRLAQEAGGTGTWAWNLKTGQMQWSAQMFALTGLKEGGTDLYADLVGALHPDDRAEVAAAFARFQTRPGPLRVEARVVATGGEIRWLVFLGQVETDSNDQPSRMLGIALDGTLRHRAEEAIRQDAERLRLAMKAGRLATWEFDVANQIRRWSAEAAVMHGFPPDRTVMARLEWRALIHPDDRPRVIAAFNAAIESGAEYSCEYRILHGETGEVRWTSARGSVLRDAAGRSVLVVGVVQDVTERRRDEERLRQLNRTLEEQVETEIAAREAAQARAAHAERMQVLGQLAGGIAHDFNNVLQAVQGGASMIERRPDNPDSVQRFARLVLRAVSRGSGITGRLLAFSRRSDLRAEALDTVELLHGLCEILNPVLGPTIAVRVVHSGPLPPVLADRGQLETALINLATNGRDAMPGGGPLTLAATSEMILSNQAHRAGLRPGRYVRLSVSDEGIGMDAGTVARASEPFFTTKPPGKGTGLGLAMARGFAEQSNGGLAITSKVGLGTTVTMWLPAAGPAVTGDPPHPETRSTVQNAAASVLLVDDDALVREVLALELEGAGYVVQSAASGSEAMHLLGTNERFDALVTDLAMPEMDGVALIRAAQDRRPALPAVLLTGYAGDDATPALTGALSGRFSLLRKPVSGTQLADRVAALLAIGPIMPT